MENVINKRNFLVPEVGLAAAVAPANLVVSISRGHLGRGAGRARGLRGLRSQPVELPWRTAELRDFVPHLEKRMHIEVYSNIFGT